jgi:hypothetical protein
MKKSPFGMGVADVTLAAVVSVKSGKSVDGLSRRNAHAIVTD